MFCQFTLRSFVGQSELRSETSMKLADCCGKEEFLALS